MGKSQASATERRAMWTPGPDREPEHEMEQEAPGDEPRIEIGENPPYDPNEEREPAREAAAEDDDTLADVAPDMPGEDPTPTNPDR
jgi:hypothetical protein